MAKELTAADKLKNLHNLQLIDSKIDEIEVLKGELPIEVKDLEDEIEGLQTRINKLKDRIDDLQEEASKHKSNIQESTALIERYEKQMDNVKNNREYDELSKELELQKLEIQLSEKRIIETNLRLNRFKEEFDQANEKMAGKRKNLDHKQVELQDIIEKTEKEEAKLRKASEKAEKGIEERLLKAYKKTRENYRNGLAVVTVQRNSCGGCFNKIPPQLQLEIAMQKKVIVCEHCGRILVDDGLVNEEA